MWEGGLDEQDGRPDVDRVVFVQHLDGQVFERQVPDHGGVVDEHIEPPPLFDDGRDDPCRSARISQIVAKRETLATIPLDLADDGVERRLAPSDDRHRIAAPGQAVSDPRADAGSAAGDDGDSPLICCHLNPPADSSDDTGSCLPKQRASSGVVRD